MGKYDTKIAKIKTALENVFVKNNDSRLSDAREPTSHTHGNISNQGKISSDISTVNKIVVTDGTTNIKTINKLPADKITHQDISGKVDKVSGKSLVSDSEITKLSHVDDYANKTTVEDNLTSTSSTNALSANMGKKLTDTKLNIVDAQSEVTRFTNKDRINIDRLINYMENGSGSNYYTLDLKACWGDLKSTCVDGVYIRTNVSFSDNQNRFAINNKQGWFICLGAMIYKNGVAQPSMTNTITFKLIDGTVIGTANGNICNITEAGDMKKYKTIDPIPMLSKTVFNSVGIYYVYAEATIDGSVVKSNILSVFVKDTNNKIDYNQWSGTEYNKDTIGITSLNNSIMESVNNWSDIGECSLKITRKDSSLTTVCKMNIPNLTVGSNINLKLTVYTPNTDITVRLMDNNTIISDVVVPQSDTPTIVNLNGGVTNSTLIMRIVMADNNSYCYLDNISAS